MAQIVIPERMVERGQVRKDRYRTYLIIGWHAADTSMNDTRVYIISSWYPDEVNTFQTFNRHAIYCDDADEVLATLC